MFAFQECITVEKEIEMLEPETLFTLVNVLYENAPQNRQSLVYKYF